MLAVQVWSVQHGAMQRRAHELRMTEKSGVPICWVQRGSKGSVVVFVSGYLAGRQVWAMQGARLSRRWTVVTYDRRGVGDSGRPEHGYGLDENINDLLAVINATEAAQVHLVGHSMGGFIAQGFALAHPDRLLSLSVLSSAPYRTTRADFGVGIFVDGEGGPLRWDQQGLDRAIDLLVPEPNQSWVRLNLREGLPSALDPLQSVKTFQAFDGIDFRPRLHEINAPTLVIHGDHDRVVKTSIGRLLAEGIPRARFEVLSGIGHLPMVTDADRVCQLLEEHWSTVELELGERA